MEKIIKDITRIVEDDYRNCDEITADNLAEILLKRSEKEKYYYLCLLHRACSEKIQELIRTEIKSNWDSFDASVVRATIEGGVFKYDDFIRSTFIKLLTEWNDGKDINFVSDDNPLVCILWLYMYNYIHDFELKKMEEYASNAIMLSFITNTDSFDIDEFDDNWNFLLKSFDNMEKYKRIKMLKERREVMKRRKEKGI